MKKIPTYAALFAAAIIPLHAASDLTNPLNTYSGNSQENGNGAAQPLFLSGDPLADPVVPPSGLEASFLAASFSPTAAFETIFFNNTTPPVGEFPGVKFGSNRGNPTQAGGNDGRNYMRTVEADYYTQDFTAYVTVKRSAPTVGTNRRSVFLGLGTGALNSGSANPMSQPTSSSKMALIMHPGVLRMVPAPSLPIVTANLALRRCQLVDWQRTHSLVRMTRCVFGWCGTVSPDNRPSRSITATTPIR
jgi:hypothetical protein